MRTIIPHRIPALFLLFWTCTSGVAMDGPAVNPPSFTASVGPVMLMKPMAPLPSPTLWSIGAPTNDEQYYLELINRARANPPAEGTRLRNTTDADVLSAYSYFGVNLVLMESEFAAITAAQPLAFHQQLITAARDHCQYLFNKALQSHTGSGGSSLIDRINATGYSWNALGECVYSYSESVFYGHAGFEVDWGPGTGGMQAGRGHRVNIHNASFREIGIGVINGSNTVSSNTVGPQLVVEDLANRFGITPLITGVVFTDGDSDTFYDPGEGVGGITVTVTGASYYAVTSTSGGYAVPVPGNGTYTVTFTAADGITVISSQSITVAGLLNAKSDVTNAPIGSGTPAGPEIVLSRGGVGTIADGGTDTVTSSVVGTPTAFTYLATNSGSTALTLGASSLGTLMNCTASVTTAPAASVAASGSTTLVVTITPIAIGAWSCPLSMVTNDSDENPTDWTIAGSSSTGSGGGGSGSSSSGSGGGCGAGGGSAGVVGLGLLLASLSRQRRRRS